MYGLGAAVAARAGAAVDVRRYAWGQLAVTAFQLMTHYANDYFDLEADLANATPTRWSGGSRVLPSGELPPAVALIAALALAALGLVATATLAAWAAPPVAVAALLVAGALAWAYSAPPLRLLARGLGEVDTALVVTGLVPFAAFALQARAGDAVATLLAAVAPLAILQFAMLLAIEFPDAAGDAATGKRTLVVRLGGARAARLHAAANVAAIGALVAAAGAGLPVVPALAVAPLAAWRASRALAGDGGDPRRHESTAFWAVALVALTGALELAGLVYPALGWPSPR